MFISYEGYARFEGIELDSNSNSYFVLEPSTRRGHKFGDFFMKRLFGFFSFALLGLLVLAGNTGCSQVDGAMEYVGLSDDRDPAFVEKTVAFEDAADAVIDQMETAEATLRDIETQTTELRALQAQYTTEADVVCTGITDTMTAIEALESYRVSMNARSAETESNISEILGVVETSKKTISDSVDALEDVSSSGEATEVTEEVVEAPEVTEEVVEAPEAPEVTEEVVEAETTTSN